MDAGGLNCRRQKQQKLAVTHTFSPHQPVLIMRALSYRLRPPYILVCVLQPWAFSARPTNTHRMDKPMWCNASGMNCRTHTELAHFLCPCTTGLLFPASSSPAASRESTSQHTGRLCLSRQTPCIRVKLLPQGPRATCSEVCLVKEPYAFYKAIEYFNGLFYVICPE